MRPHTGPHTVSESASGTNSRSRRAGPMRADMSIWRTVQTSLQGPKALMFRTPDMGTRSDVHLLNLGSPCRAAGVRHSEFSFAQLRADSSMLRAKVNCECLTPAVVLHALRDGRSGHLSPAVPNRRSPLAQGLMALLTGHTRSSEHKHLAGCWDVVGGASRETPARRLGRSRGCGKTGPRAPYRQRRQRRW